MKYPLTTSDFLISEVAELYNAEIQLTLALPNMQRTSSSTILEPLLSGYLRSSWNNASQLALAKMILAHHACNEFSDCMTLLIDKCQDAGGIPIRHVRITSLLSCLQRINYFKLAIYENIHGLSRLQGSSEVCAILGRLLERELTFREMLTQASLHHHAPVGLPEHQTVSLTR
jgi:ferritin-like metal-binding protein YciE